VQVRQPRHLRAARYRYRHLRAVRAAGGQRPSLGQPERGPSASGADAVELIPDEVGDPQGSLIDQLLLGQPAASERLEVMVAALQPVHPDPGRQRIAVDLLGTPEGITGALKNQCGRRQLFKVLGAGPLRLARWVEGITEAD